MERTKKKWSTSLSFFVVLTFMFVGITTSFSNESVRMEEISQKKVVAYFAGWSDGPERWKAAPKGTTFNVHQIPWDKVTHINYAFAGVNEKNEIDFTSKDDRALAIEKSYQGQSSEFSYKGHFNLLNTYKKKKEFSHVKTLISVGGWEASYGFFTMATTPQGRETFANSVVKFLKTYGFDGVDIDWEYPTPTEKAGNPKDLCLSDSQRATLYSNYVELLKVIKTKLDAASKIDRKGKDPYLLTAAASASSWVLGASNGATVKMGLDYIKYLDYVNLMTYDFHGAWNGFVSHHSALMPDPNDPETKSVNMEPTLNTDWAVNYYLKEVPAEKINIGIPFYTRGWKNVTPSTDPGGLHGTTPRTVTGTWTDRKGNQVSQANMGTGADGVEGIWNDPSPEPAAGANPIWHIKNLEKQPGYVRYFDDVAKVPYLWNESKKVFISYEDEESAEKKAQYVVDKGLGGVMIWELSGDFGNSSDGKFTVGDTLMSVLSNTLNKTSNRPQNNNSTEDVEDPTTPNTPSLPVKPEPTTESDNIPDPEVTPDPDTTTDSDTLPEVITSPNDEETPSNPSAPIDTTGEETNTDEEVDIEDFLKESSDLDIEIPDLQNPTVSTPNEEPGGEVDEVTSEGVGTWKMGATYRVGDKVTYNGKTYVCLTSHTVYASNWTPENAGRLWK